MLYENWKRTWKSALAENFYLKIICGLLVVTVIITLLTMYGQDKIIVVPPNIDRTVWVAAKDAAPEYLEMMGVFFATFLGNISPATAEYNTDVLLKFIPSKEHEKWKTDLKAQAFHIVKNSITQSFFLKNVEVYPKDKRVEVMGTLQRNVGTVRASSDEVKYIMEFAVDDYKLRIVSLDVYYVDRQGRKLDGK